MKRIGYIIPEFPGQTHIWMWREISQMRAWGVPITLFSTRRPTPDTRARHAFAEAAEREAIYLWPSPPIAVISAAAWCLFRHPLGVCRAIWIGFTLPVDQGRAWRSVLPLLLPAMVFARRCAQRRVEHLHSHTCSGSALLCMMVKRILGIPFSMTLNANIEWWGGAMAEKFTDAEFTIAITERLLAQMRADFPALRPGQALLGRIGVDTDKWKPVPRDAPSDSDSPDTAPPPSAIRLVSVGRLHASKGHDILLRAVRTLVDRGRDVNLRLIGSGPEEENLRALAMELKLSQRVDFRGSRSEDEIIQDLQQSDVFVLASHAEPLGVVYMEAMALGLPTIGTRAGGVPEIITDGVDGILAPPNDPPAIAAAVERLIDDAVLRRTIGSAARRRIIDAFDSRIGAAALYQRIFGDSPPGE